MEKNVNLSPLFQKILKNQEGIATMNIQVLFLYKLCRLIVLSTSSHGFVFNGFYYLNYTLFTYSGSIVRYKPTEQNSFLKFILINGIFSHSKTNNMLSAFRNISENMYSSYSQTFCGTLLKCFNEGCKIVHISYWYTKTSCLVLSAFRNISENIIVSCYPSSLQATSNPPSTPPLG